METDRLVRKAGKTFTTWRPWLSIKPSANLAGLLALPCRIAEFSCVLPHNEEEKTVDPDELSTTNTKLLNNYFWQMVISTSKRAPNVRCFELFHLQVCFVPQRLHFFDMSTSKSAPNAKCFELFHLQICFARQRRALFRQFNFQKWSEREVFWAVSLANVLRATTACNIVQLFISHLTTWLRTRRFSEPIYFSTLRSHESLEKHSESRLFYLFTHLHLLSSDSFSSLIFSLLLFSSLTLPISSLHLSILSEVWLLSFLQKHVDLSKHVRKQPSELHIFFKYLYIAEQYITGCYIPKDNIT